METEDVVRAMGAERDRRGTHGGWCDFYEGGYVRTYDHEEPDGLGCSANMYVEQARGSGEDGNLLGEMFDYGRHTPFGRILLSGDARLIELRQRPFRW